MAKRRLGRGLAALIGDDSSEEGVLEDARSLRHLPIELLFPNPQNPRRRFKDEELEDLARSIREKGLLQPIVVRPLADARGYEIVAGERRWRAAQLAQMHDVPALVREVSDGEALEIALIENIQRTDLNPLEEAQGYQQLIERFGYTQQQLAESLGKSRSHVANTLRLMSLPEKVRSYIESGSLTAGHARALVATKTPSELADEIIRLGLSVREAEELTRSVQGKPKGRNGRSTKRADVRDLERRLAEALGLKVDIIERGQSGGQVAIHYKSLEQLDEICRRLVPET
jgi:ParB family chromosome partitioning protein